MNTIHIHKVLSKGVKYFQGVYPLFILLSTHIKPSIIVINLDKHYMPGSHWVAVCFSDSGYAKYFDSYGLDPTTIQTWNHSIPRPLLNILDI